jgi:hypothetical protein
VKFNAPNFSCKSNGAMAVAFNLESHAGPTRPVGRIPRLLKTSQCAAD